MFDRSQLDHRSPVNCQDHLFTRLGHFDQLIELFFSFDYGDAHGRLPQRFCFGILNHGTGNRQRHAEPFAKSTPFASGPNQVTSARVTATTAHTAARAKP